MTPESRDIAIAARAAMVGAAVMIANQVAGKATRDALFLSTYDVTDLPLMLIAAAVISIVVVLLTTRLLTRFGPGRVMPPAFVLSAALLLGWWALIGSLRGVAAIGLYLHLAVFGAVLISGFWSLVNERFDPRTAKKRISRIAAGATLGGLLGGVLAERVAAMLSTASMLPILAAMHLLCAVLVLWVRPVAGAARRKEVKRPAAQRSGFRVLAEVPYLQNLGLLILLGTVSAGLFDYVFKDAAVGHYGNDGEALMRFFAVFYTVLGVATFIVQTTLGRLSVEKLGLARTAATVPLVLIGGGFGMLGLPGLPLAAVTRGLESVLRSSVFRGAYELMYTPISARDKRATKTIIDVGLDRLGDAVGGGLIRAVLFLVPVAATSVLVVLGLLFSAAAIWVVRRLHRGYVGALEASLLTRAAELDIEEPPDVMSSGALMQTLAAVDLREVMRAAGASDAMLSRVEAAQKPDTPGTEAAGSAAAAEATPRTLPPATRDPTLERIADLRSGDVDVVFRQLDTGEALTAATVPHIVALLAWDEVHRRAVVSLRGSADRFVGQLVDSLLDPDEEFAIRRRLPKVLSGCSSLRAIDGLLAALGDRRFEVRFQTGLALSSIHRRDTTLPIDRERVFEAVLVETRVGRRVWETQRLLDEIDADSEAPFEEAFLRDRSLRSLEHVFTMLSLVLPTEALKVAYRGLHTDDRTLRGTALEYLESVLPRRIREQLWPHLEVSDERPTSAERNRDDALEALLRSNKSIEMNLVALRRKHSED